MVGGDISAEMVAQAAAKTEALRLKSASSVCADVVDSPAELIVVVAAIVVVGPAAFE